MDQNTSSYKVVPPLFPAFNLTSEENNNSSSFFSSASGASINNDQPKPLFPAYHSITGNVADGNKVKQDWLCNSSYSPSNTEIVYKAQEEIVEDKKPLKEKRKKVKHSKKNKKEIYKKHEQLNSHTVPKSDSIRNILNKKTFIEETGLSFERAFRVDSSCDPENIYYEHLEQKNIAKYKLYPNIPIGLTSDQRILWPKQSTLNDKKGFFRYFNKKAIKLLKNISLPEKIDFKTETIINSNLNFIPFAQDIKKSIIIKDYTREGCDGISTSWKEQLSQKSSSEENHVDDIDTEIRNRTVYFNQKLAESAHDVELWLDFVNFQDDLLNKNHNSSMSYTENAVVEKKIAILDKALQHNPKSIELNIFKLNLCRNLWKPDKLIQYWDELVFLNPNNVLVWEEYFAFILTNVTYFTTSRIFKLIGKCLAILSNLSEGIVQSHEAPPDIVPKMLDIFNQMCFVMKSFGYNERAIGAFQALVELNMFGEKAIEVLPISDQISFLEPFWDSGAARFGEEGALGWATTVNEQKVAFPKIATQSNLSCIEDDILNQKLSQWETWLKFERVRESHYWLPWRPDSEDDQPENDDIDDVNRTVSFEEVSKFLFRVSKEEHKFLILLHFLKFLGYNPHNFGCTFSTQNIQNTCINLDNYDNLSKTLKQTLFNTVSNPLTLKENVWEKDKISFINNIFSQSLSKFSPKYKTLMAVMQLKFYQTCSRESNPVITIYDAKKLAKSILKESENRNCLLLWLEFLKIEFLISKIKTKKTFLTLLISSCNAIAEGNMTTTEMWYFVRSYLDLCFGVQDYSFVDSKIFTKEEIISLLVCISCQEKCIKISNEYNKPTFILKAVSSFKNFLQKELKCIVQENFETCSCVDNCKFTALDCVKCYAYLQYFTNGIEAAAIIFKEAIEFLEINFQGTHKKYILELLSVHQAELLYLHTWNTNSSIKHLHLFLQSSIEIYPNSSKLLFYLIKLKSASAVVGPTRRFFSKILRKSNKLHPIVWIFALASELSIMNSILEQQNNTAQYIDGLSSCQGINWKIRSLYEKALHSPTCSALPLLWQSYMKFEILNNEIEKAQSIFHRALQNCGWYKDLMMDGIEYFHDNLKQMVDFMIEKQMRIHTPVEEIALLMEHCVKE